MPKSCNTESRHTPWGRAALFARGFARSQRENRRTYKPLRPGLRSRTSRGATWGAGGCHLIYRISFTVSKGNYESQRDTMDRVPSAIDILAHPETAKRHRPKLRSTGMTAVLHDSLSAWESTRD